MAFYTQKDIARELRLDVRTINHLRTQFAEIYPSGTYFGQKITFTEYEKDEFLNAYYRTRLPKHIHDGLIDGNYFYQKDAARYMDVSDEQFRRFQIRTKYMIPFEPFRRFKFYKKSDLDEFIKKGIDFMSERYRRMSTSRKKSHAKKIDESDEMIKPYEGDERVCCVPGCKNKTKNRLMCNSCKEANLGCVGDE